MKRIVSILLIMCLCFGIISGCGEKEPEEEKTDSEAVTQYSYESSEPEQNDDGLSAEKEEELLKRQEESKTIYADLISNIQNDIPELSVEYIIDKKDGGKEKSIHMEMLESKDATINKMAILTTTKETLLNENEITSITVFVEHNGESAGIVMFDNENGSYEPTVNTL